MKASNKPFAFAPDHLREAPESSTEKFRFYAHLSANFQILRDDTTQRLASDRSFGRVLMARHTPRDR